VIRRADNATLLYPQKLALNIGDKWRSLYTLLCLLSAQMFLTYPNPPPPICTHLSCTSFYCILRISLVFLRSVTQLLVTTNVVSSSLTASILKMEAICSSETSVLTRPTRRPFSEECSHSHCRRNVKPYTQHNKQKKERRMASSGMLRRVVLVRTTRCNIPEDGILHSHRRENLKSYKRNNNAISHDPQSLQSKFPLIPRPYIRHHDV
jgi:hypothetical protein